MFRVHRLTVAIGRVLVASLALGAALGCADRSGDDEPGSGRVVVDIAPMHGLIAPIVREGVVVETLVPPGVSPHGFALRPSDIARIRAASVVVHVGGGINPGIEDAFVAHASPDRVVSMAVLLGVEPRLCAHDHDHHHHDHAGVDPHLWLDPARVGAFLDSIDATTARDLIDPDRLDAHRRAVRAFRARAEETLDALGGARIVTQHHAFSAWLERHGIEVVDVVRDGVHLEPSPESVAALAERLRRGEVDMVFVEPQFPDALSRKLSAASGVPVGTLDPLGDGDWLAMMERNLDALRAMTRDPDAPGDDG